MTIPATAPLAYTRYGKLQGTVHQGVRVWKGIPYVQPPIGERRFRPPEAPEAWDGIRVAADFGPICPQPVTGSFFGMNDSGRAQSEDCLYLNIWSPASTDAALRPVLVWIHGGAFVTGHGSLPIYDGTSFVQRGNVLVVTLNYRLGPFGFLHLSPLGRGLSSNLGLLDQIAALHWVRDNIEAFGGDPEQVTVFGESAGSMSIAALLSMPAAKGLFKRAIMESGASQVMPPAQAEGITRHFLKELGTDTNLDLLHTVTTEQIMTVSKKMRIPIGTFLTYQPVLDPETLPREPLDAVEDGAAAGIPLLIGTNRDEGFFFVRPSTPLMKEEAIVQALRAFMPEEQAKALARSYPATTEAQAQFVTDLLFWRASLQFAEGQGNHAPVWMYRFDWTLPSHPMLGKAIHAAEIAFVFHNLQLFEHLGLRLDEATHALARRMQDAWISFAVRGTPDTEELPWPRYDTERRATMFLDRECRVTDDPDAAKRGLLLGR